jgi:uncharacterized protein YbjT (DUF2867 family)
MKIVVLGGTGRIGSQATRRLRGMGQAVMSASRGTGVDVATGAGLDRALDGAEAVIDVTDVQTDAGVGAGDFFSAAAANIASAEKRAGVGHHLALSIVGADRAGTGHYFRAKADQESAVMHAGVPFSILRSTQFFEFAEVIADWNTTEDTVRLPSTAMRPLASDDVVTALVSLVRGAPLMQATEIAGPEELRLDEFVRTVLLAHHDERYVVRDDGARPRGFNIGARVLAPGADATLTQTTLAEWLVHRSAPSVEGRHVATYSFRDAPE